MTMLAKILHAPSNFLGRKHWASVAKYFYDLAETARNEGILSLEERICDEKRCVLDENGKRAFSKNESRIFYEGLSLVLEGTDGREVRAILENLIARTAVGRIKRIALAIGLEGILAVQAGDNPRVIKKRLGSLADLRTYDLVQNICVPRKTPLYERCMEQARNESAVGSAGECDVSPNPHGSFSPFTFDGIAFLSNTAIQNALRALDSQTLSLALKDAPFSVLRKILGNMSKTSAKMLCDDIEYLTLAPKKTKHTFTLALSDSLRAYNVEKSVLGEHYAMQQKKKIRVGKKYRGGVRCACRLLRGGHGRLWLHKSH